MPSTNPQYATIKMKFTLRLLIVLILILTFSRSQGQSEEPDQILITNLSVCDGTSNKPCVTSALLVEDMILKSMSPNTNRDEVIGLITEKKNSVTHMIDAGGYAAAPGFDDYHSNSQDPFVVPVRNEIKKQITLIQTMKICLLTT